MNRLQPADSRSGTTVGKYKLHEIVGRGGMGVVYRAEHVYIGKEVAVKILHEGFGGREEIDQAVPARGARGQPDQPPQHRRRDRLRKVERRHGLLRDGAAATASRSTTLLRRERAARPAARDHHRQPDGGRAGRGARKGDRAPRSQARERHADPARGTARAGAQVHDEAGPHEISERESAVRLREDPRLRRRQGARPRRRRGARHPAGRGLRHAGVHGARDGARRAPPTRAPTSTRWA